jgi:hypothetical protein
MTCFKNNIGHAARFGTMRQIIFVILRSLGVIAIAFFFIYLRYTSLKRHVKDLGDGGIQTIFEDRKPK